MTPPDASRPSAEFERRLLQLVDEALQLPVEQRGDHLRAASGADVGLRRAAVELLRRCGEMEASDDFLSGTAASFAQPLIRAVDDRTGIAPDGRIAAVMAALEPRYHLRQEIGRGGHATVHLAQDRQLGRDVAVKLVRLDHADPVLPERFLQEIAIVAQLRHPYIVPLLESGEAAGVPYYVMPFIAGESLRQRIDREGALPLPVLLAVARDVAEALDFAHQNGVVHRDIKPENILLSGGHALVTDFGVARAYEGAGADRLTSRGIAVGTPAYMSPEQADGSGQAGPRSDIYSLACVVYEMLTGEVPFPGDTSRAILAKQMQAPVPDLQILRPGLAPAVQQALERGLAKVPAERPATAGALVELLQVGGPAPRRSRRRRLEGAALLVVILLVAAVVWRIRRGPSPGPSPPIIELDRRRIAVLYFDNLSAEADVGLIARGLTEDLIDELGGVRGLRVISPDGVRPFRERAAPVDSIARALEVGTVVGGSVTASDSVVRVTVRLIDPLTGEQLQSRTVDLPRASVLDIRSAVFADVAAFLRERLGEEIKLERLRAETASLPAWEAVKRADGLVADGVAASLAAREDDAAEFFLRADSLYAAAQRMDRDWVTPTIGRGWVALRFALSPERLVPFRPAPGDTTSPAIRMPLRAIAFADQALAASSGSAQALALRGYAREWLGTWPGAGGGDTLLRRGEADLRAAVDARPDDARSWYALGDLLFLDGRFSEANAALQQAYDGDAYLSEVRAVVNLLFFVALNQGEFAAAERWCGVGERRFPEDPRFRPCRLILLAWTGAESKDVAAAWQRLQALEVADSAGVFASQWGAFRMLVAMVAARAGMPDSATAIMGAVSAGHAAHPGSPFRVEEARVLLLLGRRAEAVRVLAEELRDDPLGRGKLLRSPWFREVAVDPALQAPRLSAP